MREIKNMIKVQVNPEQKQDHCRIECQEQKKCRELARNPIVSLVFEKLCKNSKTKRLGSD